MKLLLAINNGLHEFDCFELSGDTIEFHLHNCSKWVTVKTNDGKKAINSLYKAITWAGGCKHSALLIDSEKLKNINIEEGVYVTINP